MLRPAGHAVTSGSTGSVASLWLGVIRVQVMVGSKVGIQHQPDQAVLGAARDAHRGYGLILHHAVDPHAHSALLDLHKEDPPVRRERQRLRQYEPGGDLFAAKTWNCRRRLRARGCGWLATGFGA